MKLNLKKTFFYINIIIDNIVASEKMKSHINSLDNDYLSINSEKLSKEYPNYIISSMLVNYSYGLRRFRNKYFQSIDDIIDSLKTLAFRFN